MRFIGQTIIRKIPRNILRLTIGIFFLLMACMVVIILAPETFVQVVVPFLFALTGLSLAYLVFNFFITRPERNADKFAEEASRNPEWNEVIKVKEF